MKERRGERREEGEREGERKEGDEGERRERVGMGRGETPVWKVPPMHQHVATFDLKGAQVDFCRGQGETESSSHGIRAAGKQTAETGRPSGLGFGGGGE